MEGFIERVAILGVGLMGGSLGGALRRRDAPPLVVGWTPDGEDEQTALQRGLLDQAAESAGAAIDGADLVVLAAPLGGVLGLLEMLGEELRGRLTTDLVSLKGPVMAAAEEQGIGAGFVGSHPMCGGTGSGASAADPGLYGGAEVYLSPGSATTAAKTRIEFFWTALGARPTWIDPDEHDRRMIEVSHLPQLVANALAAELESRGRAVGDLGPGGRDMTRLAASSPSMWLDLLSGADPALGEALRAVAGNLEELAELVERSDWSAIHGLMERTARWRERE